MAVIPSSDHSLNSGAIVTIRSANVADARDLLRLMENSLETSDYLIRLPAEFSRSNRQQKAWIRDLTAREQELLIIALAGDHLIGMVDVSCDMRKRVRHTIRFGIVVEPAWQQKGVGGLLMRRLIEWADTHPVIRRIELHVHDGNRQARALYEKLGFREEGRLKNAIKYEDGRMMDDIIMARLSAGEV